MAETQDQSTVANMLNPLANGLPANVDSDLESKKAMTPEQRYIEFLEDKVARLLREAKHDKADDINVVSEVTVSRIDHFTVDLFCCHWIWEDMGLHWLTRTCRFARLNTVSQTGPLRT
jgi:hypothetical protein